MLRKEIWIIFFLFSGKEGHFDIEKREPDLAWFINELRFFSSEKWSRNEKRSRQVWEVGGRRKQMSNFCKPHSKSHSKLIFSICCYNIKVLIVLCRLKVSEDNF